MPTLDRVFTDAMALDARRTAAGRVRRRAERALDDRPEDPRRGDAGAVRQRRRAPSTAAACSRFAVSGNFLWAPDPGPVRVVTAVRKRGRRVSVVDVELNQGDRALAVRAAVTLGVPEQHDAPLLAINPGRRRDDPGSAAGLAPIGPGHPMAEIIHLAPGCDIRPLADDDGAASGQRMLAGDAYLGAAARWPPDVLFALMCGDISTPVTFAVSRTGWAPTVQLTAYLRGLPADGWLRVLCTTTQIGQTWFDEDHIVVDCVGRIVVQTRQLAMVPPP